jgi:hypothetical protein
MNKIPAMLPIGIETSFLNSVTHYSKHYDHRLDQDEGKYGKANHHRTNNKGYEHF